MSNFNNNNYNTDDYIRQALLRIDDLESRVSMRRERASTSACTVRGQPNVYLATRSLTLCEVSAATSAISVVMRYSGDPLDLYANGLWVASGSDGLLFGALSIDQTATLSVRGGRLSSFELLLTGEGVRAETASAMAVDGEALTLADAGEVRLYSTADLENARFARSGISSDIVATEQGYVLAVADCAQNAWLITFDQALNATQQFFVGKATDITLAADSDNRLCVALLDSSGSVSAGKLIGKTLVGMTTLTTPKIKRIRFVKAHPTPLLILTTDQNRTLMRPAQDGIRQTDTFHLEIRLSIGEA